MTTVVTLTPVIKLEPGGWARRDSTLPSASSGDTPAGWEERWRGFLADAGVLDVVPYEPGSPFVTTTNLDGDVLKAILTVFLSECRDFDIMCVGPLPGGYILRVGDIVLPPGDAGDLSDLIQWQVAVEHSRPEWRVLWIGHPWTQVRARGDTLAFTAPNDEEEVPESATEFVSVPRKELSRALTEAKQLRNRFRWQVDSALRGLVSDDERGPVLQTLMEGY